MRDLNLGFTAVDISELKFLIIYDLNKYYSDYFLILNINNIHDLSYYNNKKRLKEEGRT